MRLAALLGLLTLLAGAWPAAAQPPQTPFLRIAAEAHTQVVNRMAQGPGGRIVATASDDKTLRIWDAASGAALATLRVPIGAGDEGALYAVAISPDGQTLLAGGHTGFAWDKSFAIYVFDLPGQKLRGRLPNLAGPVNHLAFSPDGSRFAVALGGGAGVRLFDAATGALVRADQDGFTERATWVAFDRAGRFAVAGFDGDVRLYGADGVRLARRAPVPGARPYSVAFSAAGDTLAVGYADQPRVELLSARDLSPRKTLKGNEPGGLGAVAWGADGRLFAAGSVRDTSGAVLVRSWAGGGSGRAVDWPATRDTVFQLEATPDGGVLLASADPAFTRLGADGRRAFRKASPGLDFRDVGDQHLTLSPDGLVVELRTAAMATAWRVDVGQRLVTELPGVRALTPIAAPPPSSLSPVRVAAWRNARAPTIDGRPILLEPQELSRSFAVTPDQRHVVVGTDYALRVFGRDGQALGAAELPAAAWAIRVAGDGRSVVAAVGDGTLRWFGLDPQGALTGRVALFLAADGRRWVAWTAEGLFDHADRGGKDLVGVQLNRARGQPPDWFSFAQVYRLMYAPDAVGRRVRGEADPPGFDPAAIGAALRAAQGSAAPPEIELVAVCWAAGPDGCRPVAASAVARGIRRLDATAPAGGADGVDLVLPPGTASATVRYRLSDGSPAGSVDVFVNGRNASRAAPTRGIRRDIVLEQSIPIDAGLNQIHLRAYNEGQMVYAQSRVLHVRRDEPRPVAVAGPAPAPADKAAPARPRLFVLAAGVDRYRPAIGPLNFAVADARSVAAKVRGNVPSSYAGVDVTELYDEDATTARIADALRRIAARARSEDTVLVYLSGHGISAAGQYYFVTHDVPAPDAIPTAALSGPRLVQAMSAIPARNAMLFLDTCYAGAFSMDSASQLAHESGRYVLAAAASVEEALDAYDEHNGVFATAVLRGMSGAAVPQGQTAVSNFDLGLFVAPLVRTLAKEKRHNQSARFKIAADDAQPFSIVDVAARR